MQWQSKSGKGKKASVLEVACGSGQHAAYLARHLGDCVGRWYPTDLGMNEDKRKSIAEWAREEGASEVVQKATELDTRTKFWGDNWKSKEIDHIFLANMSHISPWSSTVGLMEGAGDLLREDGCLFMYGPFNVDNKFTSDSNRLFDQSLKSRDSSWGIRDVDVVGAEGGKNKLVLTERLAMPANNFILVLQKK